MSTAAATASRRAIGDARIEELEHLMSCGTPVEDAITRVGWTVPAALIALRRRRHPLAATVEPIAWAARKRDGWRRS